MSKYEIVTCSDQNYFKYAGVMICSILEHSNVCKDINFTFIINSSVDINLTIELEAFVKSYGSTITFPIISDAEFDGFPVSAHISKAIYYVINIPNILNSVDKALYLDCDLIVTQPIEDLYKIDIAEKSLAAVPYPRESQWGNHLDDLGIFNGKYFNSGVMLMNLAYQRDFNSPKKAVEFIRNNPEVIKTWDQDALNAVLKGTWEALDINWNYAVSYSMNYTDLEYNLTERTVPSIIHFTGKDKPWKIESKVSFKKLFIYYAYLSPWKKEFKKNMSFQKKTIYILGKILKKLFKLKDI